MPTPRKSKNALLAAIDYNALGIGPETQARLEAFANSISDLGRRSTEQTFELGDYLNSAAEISPEGAFDRWVKPRCNLQPRSARNYVAVFRNLSPYRDDLVDLSVSTTVLFHLSSATPDQIDAAITFAEDNGRLQVKDVKALLGNGVDGKAGRGDQAACGGVTGLKALVAIKVRDGLKLFLAHVEKICQAIVVALGKKRVIKEALAKEVQDLARVARQELESLALFVEPELDFGRNTRPTKCPPASEWAVVNDTLLVLGTLDNWPRSGAMRGWLEGEGLPVLGWAISRERKPVWPLARPAVAAPETEDAVERHQVCDVPPLAAELEDFDELDESTELESFDDLEVSEDLDALEDMSTSPALMA